MTSHHQFGNLADATGFAHGSPATPFPSPFANVTTFQHNDGPEVNFNNSTLVLFLFGKTICSYMCKHCPDVV